MTGLESRMELLYLCRSHVLVFVARRLSPHSPLRRQSLSRLRSWESCKRLRSKCGGSHGRKFGLLGERVGHKKSQLESFNAHHSSYFSPDGYHHRPFQKLIEQLVADIFWALLPAWSVGCNACIKSYISSPANVKKLSHHLIDWGAVLRNTNPALLPCAGEVYFFPLSCGRHYIARLDVVSNDRLRGRNIIKANSGHLGIHS